MFLALVVWRGGPTLSGLLDLSEASPEFRSFFAGFGFFLSFPFQLLAKKSHLSNELFGPADQSTFESVALGGHLSQAFFKGLPFGLQTLDLPGPLRRLVLEREDFFLQGRKDRRRTPARWDKWIGERQRP